MPAKQYSRPTWQASTMTSEEAFMEVWRTTGPIQVGCGSVTLSEERIQHPRFGNHGPISRSRPSGDTGIAGEGQSVHGHHGHPSSNPINLLELTEMDVFVSIWPQARRYSAASDWGSGYGDWNFGKPRTRSVATRIHVQFRNRVVVGI